LRPLFSKLKKKKKRFFIIENWTGPKKKKGLPREDLADEATLDAVGLDHDVGALSGHGEV